MNDQETRELQRLRRRLESQTHTIHKLEKRIKEISKGLYFCGECGRPTAKPLSIGPGIVVCSKKCRLERARKLRRK